MIATYSVLSYCTSQRAISIYGILNFMYNIGLVYHVAYSTNLFLYITRTKQVLRTNKLISLIYYSMKSLQHIKGTARATTRHSWHASTGRDRTGRYLHTVTGSLQLQKSVGTEPGFTLFLSSIQALSIRCAQQLFFFVFNGTTPLAASQNSSSDTGVANHLLFFLALSLPVVCSMAKGHNARGT